MSGIPTGNKEVHAAMATPLGDAMREFRREHGITYSQFARMCGINHTYLRSIERGKVKLSFANGVYISKGIRANGDLDVAATRLLDLVSSTMVQPTYTDMAIRISALNETKQRRLSDLLLKLETEK